MASVGGLSDFGGLGAYSPLPSTSTTGVFWLYEVGTRPATTPESRD